MSQEENVRQRVRDEQRTRILEAARRVFAHKGLAATMDDIASEAAISHGLAYRYFANKEAIVSELVTQTLNAPEAGLHQHIQTLPGTPGERLTMLVKEFIESRRHPEFYLLLDQVLRSKDAPDELRDLIHKRGQEIQDALRYLIVEGQTSGEVVAGNPDQLARAIIACCDGLTQWAARDPNLSLEHFPDADIFLRMLKPERTQNMEDMK